MAEHLTPEQLEQYRRGTATPADLLAFDDHLSQCEICRTALEKLVTPMTLTRWAEGLGRYEEKLEEKGNETPLTEESPARPVKAPARWRWPRLIWVPALAAAAVALVVVVWRRPEAAPVEQSKAIAPPAETKPPAYVASLNDAGGMIQLDVNGFVHVPGGVEHGQETLLADVMKEKALPLAALPSDLAAPPGTLLGPSKPDEFAPLGPLSAIVYTDRPEFRWQALAGATAYEVQIFDSGFRQLDSSGKIRQTSWTPVRPLPRGGLYQWQVIAYRGDDTVRTPTPPAPDARFRILNAQTFEKVEAARTGAQPAHLLAAILLAKAGMKEEARKELESLAAENPDSQLVKEITDKLQK